MLVKSALYLRFDTAKRKKVDYVLNPNEERLRGCGYSVGLAKNTWAVLPQTIGKR